MTERKLSRRDFLRMAAGTVAGATMAKTFKTEAQEPNRPVFSREDIITSAMESIKFQQQLLYKLEGVSNSQESELQDSSLRENLAMFLIGYDSIAFTDEELSAVEKYAKKKWGEDTFERIRELGGISGLWSYRSILTKILRELVNEKFLEINSNGIFSAFEEANIALVKAMKQRDQQEEVNFKQIMPFSFDNVHNQEEKIFGMFLRYGIKEKDAIRYCKYFLSIAPVHFIFAVDRIFKNQLPFIPSLEQFPGSTMA